MLIHEALHVILARVVDEARGGSGRNFAIAGCYEVRLPELLGFDSVADCPPPP